MMSILEYSIDIDKDVNVVINKCEQLGFNVSNEEDMLNDEQIIELDNLFANEDMDENLDDVVLSIAEAQNIDVDNNVTKQKLKKKDSTKPKENFTKLKKEMYKNKTKLTSNEKVVDENIVLYKEGMSVSALADAVKVDVKEIIKKIMNLGLMLNMNSAVDFDTAELICVEYSKTLKKEQSADITNFEEYEISDNESDLIKRPPVVTIMGHVDHGKTSLLDYIRKSSVVDLESGGITQHIGAYQITHNDNKITFIDTPGHAAFSQMRARGASVTDIIIIIVAADDGVMPQTIEAIDHAKDAGVPIVVVVNKIDKEGANPEKVMTGLAEHNIIPEEWGGDTLFCKVSAKTGEGIEDLLDNLLLISEMQELKANPNRYAVGTVLESKLDKNIGSTTTLLVQNGTLRLGDPIVVGSCYGKIRTLKNDLSKDLIEAFPGDPVSITGLSNVASAGDKFMSFESEKQAKSIAHQREIIEKEKHQIKGLSIEDLFSSINSGNKEIKIILKADVKGSEEAVKHALLKIEVDGVVVKVIRSDVGTITESDITLAASSNAIIVGFNIRPNAKTMDVAKSYGVEIRLHQIIYKLIEEIEGSMKGMLDKIYEEKVTGHAEVRRIFKFSKVGNIAGSYVVDGVIKNNTNVRLIRNEVIIYDGKLETLQREKDSVKEVKAGFECGITLDTNDILENDIIETYESVEVKR